MTGSGILIPGVLGLGVFDGGVIEPGVTVLAQSANFSPFAAPALPIIQPGALNIGGNVSISPTAVITLDVIGKTPSLYDRLIITGTAKLGGKFVLNFGDGFAPQQGDISRSCRRACLPARSRPRRLPDLRRALPTPSARRAAHSTSWR